MLTTIDTGTYDPHLEDCYLCHEKWTEENLPFGFYEHYICKKCAEKLITQQGRS